MVHFVLLTLDRGKDSTDFEVVVGIFWIFGPIFDNNLSLSCVNMSVTPVWPVEKRR